MLMDYHVRGTMLECWQRYTPKLTNTAELKECLLTIWNDLPISRQWYHFSTNFNHVLLQLMDILNTLFKYWVSNRWLILITEISETLRKRCASFIYYSRIFNAWLRVHLKNCTFKFKLLYLLNHICFFSTKFAGCVVWILTYTVWKFGPNMCYCY